jgi:hypothetical protein
LKSCASNEVAAPRQQSTIECKDNQLRRGPNATHLNREILLLFSFPLALFVLEYVELLAGQRGTRSTGGARHLCRFNERP